MVPSEMPELRQNQERESPTAEPEATFAELLERLEALRVSIRAARERNIKPSPPYDTSPAHETAV